MSEQQQGQPSSRNEGHEACTQQEDVIAASRFSQQVRNVSMQMQRTLPATTTWNHACWCGMVYITCGPLTTEHAVNCDVNVCGAGHRAEGAGAARVSSTVVIVCWPSAAVAMLNVLKACRFVYLAPSAAGCVGIPMPHDVCVDSIAGQPGTTRCCRLLVTMPVVLEPASASVASRYCCRCWLAAGPSPSTTHAYEMWRRNCGRCRCRCMLFLLCLSLISHPSAHNLGPNIIVHPLL